MSDFDLDRLGDVWRQQPEPEEMERLQRSAAVASRRARWGQLVEASASIAVAAVVVILVFSNPQTNTFLMGGAAILVLLASHIRQRRLREVELRGLAGGTEDMLDQMIARGEAALKRNRFSIVALAPTMLIGLIFMRAVTHGPGQGFWTGAFDSFWFRALWKGGAFVLLAAGILYFALAIVRGRREHERLTAMREAYREERESSAE